MRNAASTLEELVAPLTEAEFLSVLRERKVTLLRGANGDRYKALVGWEALKRMIERGEYPRGRDDIRVAKESARIPPERWTSKGKVDTAKLEECLASKFSVIITHIEPHIPTLAALCDNITSRLLEASFAGVIVTTGTADGAFKIHYDPEDLIILQIEGTKRWQIYGPAVSNPVIGMPKQLPPESAPIFDEVLQPGDFLFVPGGNWHHCENGLSRSVHLGIFFVPPTGWHAVRALTSELLSEEMFRAPLTRLEGAAELAALEADVKNRLIEKIGQLKLNEFLGDWIKKA
jgi:ribosomal protein L16 Arg81 hydroxylase